MVALRVCSSSVVGDRDRPAAREVVGVARSDARAEDVGVGREAGVHVQVAEERLPQRRDGGARLARLCTLPRRCRGRREGFSENGEQDEPGPSHGWICNANAWSLSSKPTDG